MLTVNVNVNGRAESRRQRTEMSVAAWLYYYNNVHVNGQHFISNPAKGKKKLVSEKSFDRDFLKLNWTISLVTSRGQKSYMNEKWHSHWKVIHSNWMASVYSKAKCFYNHFTFQFFCSYIIKGRGPAGGRRIQTNAFCIFTPSNSVEYGPV